MSRRGFLAGAAGVTSVVALGAGAPSASAVSRRISLGAYTDGMDVSSKRLNNLSASLRQPLSIASVFRGPGDIWPGPVESSLALGRVLLVAWYLDDHSYAYWASEAARPELVAVARRVKAHGNLAAIRLHAVPRTGKCS